MGDLRVPNHRGFALWFVLPIVLLIAAILVAVTAPGSDRFILSAIFGSLALAGLIFALTGVMRSIDFGSEIVIRHFARDRRIPWDHLAFVSFDESHGSLRTGIPFVSIPTVTHTMTLRLLDGKDITSYIHPAFIPMVTTIVQEKATLDWESERKRRVALVQSDARGWHYVFAMLGLFSCGLGICTLYLMSPEIAQGWRSRDWPAVVGNVTNWSVGSEEHSDRGTRSVLYFPMIAYRYTVNGKEYNGNRFHFSPWKSSDHNEVMEWLRDIRHGNEVTVHFRPDDPTISVIVPGLYASRYVFCTVLVAMVFGGPIVAVFQFHRAKRLS